MRLENAPARAPGRGGLHRSLCAYGAGLARWRSGDLTRCCPCAIATRPSSSTTCARSSLGEAHAVAPVSALLRAPQGALRVEALKALSVLPPDRGLRERVIAEVGSPEPWVRAAALQALARMEREDFALVLANLDPDPAWFVRAGLAAALAIAGDEASQARLLAMLKDDDVRVIPYVLEALRQARGPDSVDTLRRHLDHPDFAVRMAAADQLAALKVTGLSEALAASLTRSRGDVEMDARLSLVPLLALQKDARAAALLREIASGDPARPCATRGREPARPATPPPGPEPVGARPRLPRGARPTRSRPAAGLHAAVFLYEAGPHRDPPNVVERRLMSATFLDLARRGCFDGSLPSHGAGLRGAGRRSRGDGNGGPGAADETRAAYGRGVVGMALSGKDTGGSQSSSPSPPPAPGRALHRVRMVASGMEVVDKIRPGDVIEKVEAWTGR